jgi:hypothetical protein
MAAANKRHPDFRVIKLDYGKKIRPGNRCLALPPESGPDVGDKQIQDIEDDLHNRLTRGDEVVTMQNAIDDHLFRIYPNKQQRSYTCEDKYKVVSAWLEDGSDFYWLLNLSDDDNQNQRTRLLAQQLKSRYPKITLLSLNLDIDSEITETKLNKQLADTQSTD